ncbi:hypothetical protein BH23BAC2_BH23BAC2_07980 [soil metagenome]
MRFLKITFTIIGFFILSQIKAQDTTNSNIIKPPVTIEFLAGNSRLFSQLILNRSITKNQTFGLLNVSSFAANYENNGSNNEYFSFSALNYRIGNGFSVNAGGTFNTAEGLKPLLGMQYTYSNKELLIIYLPAYYYLHSRKIFNLILLEYRLKITNKWSSYSRLQANYQYDFEISSHFRSYLYLRLGATYKNITFGAGTNLDQYGPNKAFKENYGAFIKLNL